MKIEVCGDYLIAGNKFVAIAIHKDDDTDCEWFHTQGGNSFETAEDWAEDNSYIIDRT
jgi:hypothetical protein